MVKIDREKTTPFLIQVFPSSTAQHHPESAYSSHATPVDPLNLYAWRDTTIRELLISINTLKSIANSTRYDLSLLYHNSNTQRYNSKHFSSGNFSVKDLSFTPSTNPKLEKTLIQCNFEVGDYLDLVYISPPAPLPSSNPSTLYSDRNTSTNRLPPLAPGRNQPFAPRNSFPTGPGGARDRAGPPQGSRNGNAIGGGRGDGNAPAGAWGRNAPGGGGRDERGRDGPPHKADTWAPTARGNGRASFDSRDNNQRRPFNTSNNNNNRRSSRSRSPARRPSNANRRSPSRSRSRSRSRSPAPRKQDDSSARQTENDSAGERKVEMAGGDVEMN